MMNELCIGEYEMHQECRICKIQSACEKKYKKLLTIVKSNLENELPNRAKSKSYQELQIIEAKRQRAIDSMKKVNRIRAELHIARYEQTKNQNDLYGIKEE